VRLATFRLGNEDRVGVADVEHGVVHDVTDLLPSGAGVLDLITDWTRLRPALGSVRSTPAHPLDAVTLRAPIPEPRRDLFCVGKNYREHAVEFSRSGYDAAGRSEELPTHPVVFAKATTAVTGPFADIDPHPGLTREIDYEAELAVIIGKGGRDIPRGRASDHVWGYTIINDVTARDLQRAHEQWLLGKSLDTFCPMGPFAVSADEITDVTALGVSATVNGERRQSGTVKDLIFDIPDLMATISAGITLLPGDIIATGTPAGVGIGFTPPRFLTPGDVVEVSITGLGTLRNRVGHGPGGDRP
jgi:2-keto-4-pentenoate hydratase/2-oxohepta-3-ene-1,7-dioic acid hydratase in catechol pathway